jgi:hypothetical protein
VDCADYDGSQGNVPQRLPELENSVNPRFTLDKQSLKRYNKTNWGLHWQLKDVLCGGDLCFSNTCNGLSKDVTKDNLPDSVVGMYIVYGRM